MCLKKSKLAQVPSIRFPRPLFLCGHGLAVCSPSPCACDPICASVCPHGRGTLPWTVQCSLRVPPALCWTSWPGKASGASAWTTGMVRQGLRGTMPFAPLPARCASLRRKGRAMVGKDGP